MLSLASLAVVPSLHAMLRQNEVAYADELRTFERPVEDTQMYTSSDVVVSGDETEVIVIELARRRVGVTAVEHLNAADGAWADVLEALAAELPLRRWVRNLLVAPAPRGAAFDVVNELWFDSLDDVAASAASVEELLVSSSPLTEPAASVVLVGEVILRLG